MNTTAIPSPRILPDSIPVLLAPRRLPVIHVAEHVIMPSQERVRVAVPWRPKQAERVVHVGVLGGVCHDGDEGEASPVWRHERLEGKIDGRRGRG